VRVFIGMVLSILIAMLLSGCAAPRITLFSDASDALRETILEGSAADKILVVPITGVITDSPKRGTIRTMPGVVQEVVSHLRLAEADDRVKAVLLKIDTPGGTTTASDLLYHEIVSFKQRTGKKVVACMMNLATSGGYYVSLPADVIMAHPTTVTGSVGVILMRPEVSGLMEKIGVTVAVNKSGKNKDMGSPFHPTTPAEEAMLQELADALGRRFIHLVRQHRGLDDQHLAVVADARVFLADAAVTVGLVDKIGYLSGCRRRGQKNCQSRCRCPGSGLPPNPLSQRQSLQYPHQRLPRRSNAVDGPGPLRRPDGPGRRLLLPLAPGFGIPLIF
jgi:protease-4